MGTVSAVPSGLAPTYNQAPNVETLGYYRPSLRDDELQIVVTLDKNVPAPTAVGSSLRKISDAHITKMNLEIPLTLWEVIGYFPRF